MEILKDFLSQLPIILRIVVWLVGLIFWTWFVFWYPTSAGKNNMKDKPHIKNQRNIGPIGGDYVEGNKITNTYPVAESDKELKAIKEHLSYQKKQLELELATGKLKPPFSDDTKETYELLFGTNRFLNTPKILITDGIPLVTFKVKNNELLVSATVYDDKGQVLALIKDNECELTRDERLKTERRPNSLKLWDENNNLLLDCELLSNKEIKLNGIFRNNGGEIIAIATDKGLQISSLKTRVELGGK